MTTYWVSWLNRTPVTIRVDVDEATDRICGAAPYARAWMQGQPWPTIRARLAQRYGATLRIVSLSTPATESSV